MRNRRKQNQNPDQRPGTRQTTFPCFKETLVKLGLAKKSIAIPAAFQLFTKIGSDLVVSAKKAKGFPRKKITAPYLATALKLAALSAEELKALKIRIANGLMK